MCITNSPNVMMIIVVIWQRKNHKKNEGKWLFQGQIGSRGKKWALTPGSTALPELYSYMAHAGWLVLQKRPWFLVAKGFINLTDLQCTTYQHQCNMASERKKIVIQLYACVGYRLDDFERLIYLSQSYFEFLKQGKQW